MKKKNLFLLTLICLFLLASFFVYKTFDENKKTKTINSFKDEKLLYDEEKKEYQIDNIVIDYNFHPYLNTDTGIYSMKGEIKNNDKSTIRNLRITIDFYDANMELIGSFVVKVDKIKANSTVSVSQDYGKSLKPIYTFKISDIKGYRR